MLRKIITIDEEKCDGCGLCVPSCREGALKVIDGKVRLVSDLLCDGLGACLGDCPRGAIKVEEREAAAFDEAAVERHLGRAPAHEAPAAVAGGHHHHGRNHGMGGCPGSAMRTMQPAARRSVPRDDQADSALAHWPVQLMLVSPGAPFLRGSDLLVCADCVPFAVADFHSRFLAGKAVVVGCPKLDDLEHYREKLRAMFQLARPRSLTVVRMEVPCCGGIAQAALEAWEDACPDAPAAVHIVGIDGSTRSASAGAA